MVATVCLGLLVAAFLVAGGVNVLGVAGAARDFARWGYTGWWRFVTGGLEIVAAALIAAPPARDAGLLLGAAIVAAATVTVLRVRELSHLAPLGAFAALLVAVAYLS